MIVSVLLHRVLDLSPYAGGSSQPMSKPCSFTQGFGLGPYAGGSSQPMSKPCSFAQGFGLEPLLHPMDKPYRTTTKKVTHRHL